MRKVIVTNIVLIGGGLLLANLFYQEQMGLNTILFSIPILVMALAKHRHKAPYSLEVSISAAATFLAALAVVGNASALAKVMYWISLLTFLGFIQHQYLRFIPFAFSAALGSLALLPKSLYQSWSRHITGTTSIHQLSRQLLRLIIPLGLFSFFLFIYYLANAKFGEIIDNILAQFSGPSMLQFNVSQVLLFLLGFTLFGAGLVLTPLGNFFSVLQEKFGLKLVRKRQKRWFEISFNPLVLKNRFKIGLITLVMLNGLLFIVNLTDLFYVWLSRRPLGAVELSQYVHEGTYLLIFAILLAAAVVLFIFRKNLNFYPDNEGLKRLAYIWIGQNIFMVFSVGQRNFQYLNAYGLTHKRIGVFIFLLIVTVGLVSLYLKVRDRKSIYFLLHRNSWSVFTILLVASLINWNLLITRINLHANFIQHLDVHYLVVKLPAQNAFLLKKNEALISPQLLVHQAYLNSRLEDKVEQAQQKKNFRSWNWPYYLNQKYFKTD